MERMYMIGIFIIAALGCSGCAQNMKEPEVDLAVPDYKRNLYETCEVEQGDLTPVYTCHLQAKDYELTSYQAPVDGIVSKLYVKVGDKVKKGQTMAVFQNEELENTLRDYQNELELLNEFSLIAEKAGTVCRIDEGLFTGGTGTGEIAVQVASCGDAYEAVTAPDTPVIKNKIYSAKQQLAVVRVRAAKIKKQKDRQMITFVPVQKNQVPDAELTLEIPGKTMKNVCYVPKEAVLNRGAGDFVYALDENGNRMVKPVKVQAQVNDMTAIRQGLSLGEKVALP